MVEIQGKGSAAVAAPSGMPVPERYITQSMLFCFTSILYGYTEFGCI